MRTPQKAFQSGKEVKMAVRLAKMTHFPFLHSFIIFVTFHAANLALHGQTQEHRQATF